VRKPSRLSRVAVSLALATTGLAVTGFSVPTSGAATSSSGVTGTVSARLSAPSAPIVVANYTLNPKAVLIAANAIVVLARLRPARGHTGRTHGDRSS
jgi:hypothetical protein